MILTNHGIVSSSGGVSFDADALSFITAASITDNTQKTAVNTLITDLKAYNIWTKMKAIYPFVGGTATSHKFNLKDPRDLDAAFRLVFNGGWTHSVNGVLPNGTNAYANTGITPSTTLSQNSTHISIYSRTNNTTNGEDMGCRNSGNTIILDIELYWLGNYWFQNNAGFGAGTTSIPTTGYYINSRTSNGSYSLYKNGTSIKSQSITSVGLPPVPIYIGATNLEGTGSYHYANREIAFASIGDGLTDTEQSNFYTAVQAFQTTLSRQV